MKIATIGKILGLVLLSLVTSLVTSKIHKSLAAQPAVSGTERETGTVKLRTVESPDEAPPEDGNDAFLLSTPGTSSRFKITNHSVEQVGRGVVVKAKAKLWSKRPGTKCFWALQINQVGRDGKTVKLVSENYYLHQIFDIGNKGILTPDFTENLALPNGDYIINVAVYMIPENATPLQLTSRDYHAINSRNMTSRSDKIRVLNN